MYIRSEQLNEWIVGATFSVGCVNFTDKQGKETKIILIVMGERLQYEFMFILIYRGLHREVFIDMCIYTSQYTHIYFLALPAKRAYKKLLHPSSNKYTQQQGSWFPISSPIKGNSVPWLILGLGRKYTRRAWSILQCQKGKCSKQKQNTHTDGGYVKGTQEKAMAKAGTIQATK